MSFKNSAELNKIIDTKLPIARPAFRCQEVVVAGEAFDLYSCDIIECIEALWADPDFCNELLLQPERHFKDADMTQHVYYEMNTGKWWWDSQVNPIYLTSWLQANSP